MKNFNSKTLNRTFDQIIFVNSATMVNKLEMTLIFSVNLMFNVIRRPFVFSELDCFSRVFPRFWFNKPNEELVF